MWPKEKKLSKQARGYGAPWEKVRALVLERDGHLCQCRHCRTEGRTRVATEVDHILPKADAARMGWTQEQTDHPSNLQAINKDCHRIKSIEDLGGKPLLKCVKIGKSGWPVW